MALAQQCAEIDIGVRLDTRPRGCEARATQSHAKAAGARGMAWRKSAAPSNLH